MDQSRGQWLERAELLGIVGGAFYVGWVLASRQLWFIFDETIQPPWGWYFLGVPLGVGVLQRCEEGNKHLVHALVARVGLGVWALLGGWSLERPDLPWPVVWHLVPLIVGVHIPLALTHCSWPSRTRKFVRIVGWLAFCLAAASAFALVLDGRFLPQRFWPRMLPFVVGLPVLYRLVCWSNDPRRVRRGLVLIVVLLGVVISWLLLTHVGVA